MGGFSVLAGSQGHVYCCPQKLSTRELPLLNESPEVLPKTELRKKKISAKCKALEPLLCGVPLPRRRVDRITPTAQRCDASA